MNRVVNTINYRGIQQPESTEQLIARITRERDQVREHVTELQARMTAMLEEHRVEVAHLRGTIDTAFASGYTPGAERESIALELEAFAKDQQKRAKLKDADAPCSAFEHQQEAEAFSRAAKLIRRLGLREDIGGKNHGC